MPSPSSRDTRQIGRFDLADVDSPYPFVLMLPQSDTEAVLEQRLERLGDRSELGVELTAFHAGRRRRHRDAARMPAAASRDRSASAGWWPATARTARSATASALSFDGDTMGTDWVLGDFHLTGWPFPMSELATYWHEEGPIVFFPMAPGRYRVIASLGPSSDEFRAGADAGELPGDRRSARPRRHRAGRRGLDLGLPHQRAAGRPLPRPAACSSPATPPTCTARPAARA